jgi:hypothetical protein
MAVDDMVEEEIISEAKFPLLYPKGGDVGDRSEGPKHSTSTYKSQFIGIKNDRRLAFSLSATHKKIRNTVWLHRAGIEGRR